MNYNDARHLIRSLVLEGLYAAVTKGYYAPTHGLIAAMFDDSATMTTLAFSLTTPGSTTGINLAPGLSLTIFRIKSQYAWTWCDKDDIFNDYISKANKILIDRLGENVRPS